MKILILGGTGMLGHRLWLELSKNHEVAGITRNGAPCSRLLNYEISNINDYGEVERVISVFKPEIVINCIGLIKQDHSHDDVVLNIELNSILPHKMARLCNKYGSRLILFSTDCVFSGKTGHYKDNDFADADDVYGRSKKLGEIDTLDHVLTIRTSIIGRELRGKASLVEWFLAQENKQIKGFTKAIFSGFPTKTISEILEKFVLKDTSLHGVYNLSAEPISKYDLLNLIKKEANLNVEIIPFDDFSIDRSLDSTRFREKTGFKPKSWEELVKDIFVKDINY